MVANSQTFFSTEARGKIDTAVGEAEKNTSGEIVPVLASAAETYERALFLAGVWATLLATLLVIVCWCIYVFVLPPDSPMSWNDQGEVREGAALFWHALSAPLFILFPVQILAFLGGYYSAQGWPMLHRAFIGQGYMADRVRQAAHEAFYLFRLSETRDATGIMIYVSLFERMVVVLADKAIDEKLNQDAWDRVRDLVIDGFKTSKPEDGIVQAVEACGRILAEHFPRKSDDTNELPNHLRTV